MSQTKRQKRCEEHQIPANLVAVKDVSKNYLNFLLKEAEEMKKLVRSKGGDDRLKHKVLASVFYEVILDSYYSMIYFFLNVPPLPLFCE